LEFVLAGATAVGLGTALFYDPMAPVKVNAGIDEYLRRHDIASIAELVGGIRLRGKVDQASGG
jgi:dihydroorotate dehydrogenase (NAD+) catalytic subunit